MSNPHLTELFSSIQGEGLLVGFRQVFIRFYGCNISCRYCDTENSQLPDSALVECTPGRRDFSRISNPVSLSQIVQLLQRWNDTWPRIHHSISITGGEPLLNHPILLEWLPVLRGLLPIYLETNGIMYHALSLLLNHLDHISMDIKLPSTSGYTDLWDNHREFLIIASKKSVFVKIVVSDDTENWEITKACDLIAKVDHSIPCILQPITRQDGSIGIHPLKMLEQQELAAQFLSNVRIIPQTHKFMCHI